jgi:hypothetical protein
LPERVTDHVTKIHDHIRSKLRGDLTAGEIGSGISDLIANDDTDSQAADTATENTSETSGSARSNGGTAGPATDLPSQAVDQVSAIQDVIRSWLTGGSDGNPGEDVSSATG